MLQLDVASLTAVTHVFAQDMRARGRGKILLVASLLAYQGVQNFAVYAAAKAYVLRLGEALHRELKPHGDDAVPRHVGYTLSGHDWSLLEGLESSGSIRNVSALAWMVWVSCKQRSMAVVKEAKSR
jgi:NAD(P)-dependent dehydrogenase (short-subunit alcohol dehydrogenase family)